MDWIWILIACIGGVSAVCLGIGALTGVYAVHKIYGRRYNGNPHIKYFSANDFEGLSAEPVDFLSGDVTLRGYIYARQGQSKGVIIFSHGFGAGHTAYTTEIDRLTRAGYKVLAFDNTGCMRSGGEKLGGFDRGVADLLAAVAFARADDRLRGYAKMFVGHSWGAFSVMNAYPLAEDVVCAVAMCGFICGADVLAQNVFGKLAPLRFAMACVIRACMRARFKGNANYRSDRSLQTIAKPILLLYGEKDGTVRYRWNGKKMAAAFAGHPYVRTKTYAGKGHNVYLTDEAEVRMHAVFGAIGKIAKKDKERAAAMYREVDYAAITREDETVMEEIVAFLDGNLPCERA